MAYIDFSSTDLTRKFGIKFRAENLFPNLKSLPPTAWLIETLERGQSLGFGSEKSRAERLVTPVLLELSAINQHSFSIYSGMNLDADKALGLSGECDFVFSFSRVQDFITAPIFCIAEAKKQDLEQGTLQAAAQLIGAKKFNEAENNSIHALYGASTTGIEWRFLQYHESLITIDEKRYLISDLPKLLGALQTVVDLSRSNLMSVN
jgi:hypothetical protein